MSAQALNQQTSLGKSERNLEPFLRSFAGTSSGFQYYEDTGDIHILHIFPDYRPIKAFPKPPHHQSFLTGARCLELEVRAPKFDWKNLFMQQTDMDSKRISGRQVRKRHRSLTRKDFGGCMDPVDKLTKHQLIT